MNIVIFSDLSLEGFLHPSFPQEKGCPETLFKLYLEVSPELGDVKMISDTPSLLTKILGLV